MIDFDKLGQYDSDSPYRYRPDHSISGKRSAAAWTVYTIGFFLKVILWPAMIIQLLILAWPTAALTYLAIMAVSAVQLATMNTILPKNERLE